jgi:3-oxoacyl-[acyl-carrier-protein] synthase-1
LANSNPHSAVFLGVGARASLGASADAISTAYCAGISRQQESSSLLGRHYEPLVVAADPYLPAAVPVHRRILEMVAHAAWQAVESLDVLAATLPLDVVVAIPEPRIGIGPGLAERVLGAIQERLATRVRLAELHAEPGGRAAGLRALEIAFERLTTGRSMACLWCGVDSYLAPATLDALDSAGLLHTDSARWGIVPGEAAAACLMVTHDVLANRMGPPPLAIVRAVSSAVAQSLPEQGDVMLGRALTLATRRVLDVLPQTERVHSIYADLNGQRERVDEVGFTLARIADHVAALPCLKTPADRLGEVGAASAPLSAVLAVTAAKYGRLSGPNTLLLASGPGMLRGAALLTTPLLGD